MNKTKPEYAWDNPEVPHKGWTEECVTDLEEATHTCEMCGKQNIRFVHTMSHPEHHDLDVGCECAINMSDDYVGPVENKREATNLSKNKAAWFSKTKWEDYNKSSYRMSRTITASISYAKNNVWSWQVVAVNGKLIKGFAFNREDAKQRSEHCVKTMQTQKVKL